MPKIHLLPDTTINQIAAGEVIESSASVVKELVENAIDAGATDIEVEIAAGGQALIRVSDNGCGMARDDLVLALERHATSKIDSVNDLLSLGTLGFRGEALPSIASVAKMTVYTCASEGLALSVEGGKLGSIQTRPRQRGTTVEVRSLFYNVPVRKKFQKSVSADRAEVRSVLTQVGLCHPEVALTWRCDDQEVFSVQGAERIAPLLGEEFAQELLPIVGENVRGFIGQPSAHRPNRRGQYLFLNGRPVLSPFMAQCVLEGYGPRLPTHRFPVFVLHVNVPPDWVDVNVHPQKKEVRLRKEAEIKKSLVRAVEGALQKQYKEAVPTIMLPPAPPMRVAEEPIPYVPTEPRELFSLQGSVVATVGPYVFFQGEQLLLVDVRAARARVWYERLAQEKMPMQALLLPLTEEFSPGDAAQLTEHLEVLSEFLSIRTLGEATFVIDAIPQIFEPAEIRPWLEALLEGKRWERQATVLKVCASLKHRALSHAQVAALIEKLMMCEEPERCPLGRTTFRRVTEKELQTWLR